MDDTKDRKLHDGREDGLVPLESLSLDSVESFSDLLRAMERTAFGGRQLGDAFDILLEMFRNPSCGVVLTISGAMTVAKQGRIFADLIDRGFVGAVVCTGALIAHGLSESIGLTHYRHDPAKSDRALFQQGYNRIYDTLEMERNLNDVEKLVCSILEEEEPEDGVWSSARLCRALGKRLGERGEGPGILLSAWKCDVPVFIPAFTDSEIGLDVAIWAMRGELRQRLSDGDPLTPDEIFHVVPPFNPFLDLQKYARWASRLDRLGILTIGGGVPRNWAQQVAPFYEVAHYRLGVELRAPRFRYGVRICPEPSHWGGLSGCTYSEGVSWGKFVPASEGGRYAEVHADATTVLPLLVKAVFEEFDQTEAS